MACQLLSGDKEEIRSSLGALANPSLYLQKKKCNCHTHLHTGFDKTAVSVFDLFEVSYNKVVHNNCRENLEFHLSIGYQSHSTLQNLHLVSRALLH